VLSNGSADCSGVTSRGGFAAIAIKKFGINRRSKLPRLLLALSSRKPSALFARWRTDLRSNGCHGLGRTGLPEGALADLHLVEDRADGKDIAAGVVWLSSDPLSVGRDLTRDATLQSMLNDSFESHAMLRLKSIRKDDHDRTEACIVHAPGFCLSAAAI
jgi:hypothetical protein